MPSNLAIPLSGGGSFHVAAAREDRIFSKLFLDTQHGLLKLPFPFQLCLFILRLLFLCGGIVKKAELCRGFCFGLMIAPIYKQNAQGRYVYLPEEMMLVRMHSSKDYTTEILPKGHHYVSVGLDELVFFIRNQKAIPFAESAENTAKTDYNTIQLLGYEGSSYELYTDNGTSPNPEDSLTIKTLS